MLKSNDLLKNLLLVAITSLLLMLVGFLALESYLFGDKLMLFKDIGADSLNIYYPYAVMIARSLQAGVVPTWSFMVGMGQDISGQLAQLIFNPVVWLGPGQLCVLLAWQHLTKCVVVGLSFYGFLRLRGNAVMSSMAGGVLLAYSGYMGLGACWLFHADEVICFSILLLAAEWALGHRHWQLLPVAVGLCAAHSVMTLYFAGLLLLLYSLIRHVELNRQSIFLARALPAALAAMLGVGLGAVLLVPGLHYVFGSARGSDTAAAGVAGGEWQSKLAAALFRMFSNDALGTAENFRGWGNYLESPAFYCGMAVLLMLPQVFVKAKLRVIFLYAGMLILAASGVFFEVIRRIFWAFQSDYFRTYSLFVIILLVTLAVQALSAFERNGQLNRRLLTGTFVVLMSVLWLPFLLSAGLVEVSVQIACSIFLTLLTIVFLCGKSFRHNEVATAILIALIAGEAVHFTTKSVAHRWTMTRTETAWKSGYNDWTIEAIDWISKHYEAPYRVNKDYFSSPSSARSFNDAMVFGYWGTPSYSSFNQRGYIDFLIGAGAYGIIPGSGARWCPGTVGRPLLQAFCSERFLITRDPKIYEQTGFYKLLHIVGDVAILENRFAQPFGRAHSRWLDFKDYLMLPREAREFALLTSAVVDAETMTGESELYRVTTDILLQEMKDSFIEKLKLATELPGVSWSSVSDGRLEGVISSKQQSLLMLPIPYDENWRFEIAGKPVPLQLAGLGLIAVQVPPGESTVLAVYKPCPLWHGGVISFVSLVLFGILVSSRRKLQWTPEMFAKTRKEQATVFAKEFVDRPIIYTLLAVFVVGIALRLYPSAAFDKLGFDENLYRIYVAQLNYGGLGGFAEMVTDYVKTQRDLPSAILPPTRFLYIYFAHLWSVATGINPLQSLHDISCAFSILTLGISCIFAWRLAGKKMALGVTTLMALAPTQIHMSQHALIDGFFAFWALLSLWLLWEVLNAPNQGRRLLCAVFLGGALVLLVLTKENSFFVFIGVLGVAALAPLLGYGKWSWAMALALVLGPTVGLLMLIALAGGFSAFIETYTLLVEKAYQLEYAIKTGDGPWYRYLIDLLIVSPLVLLLAVGSAFRACRGERATLYLLTFLGFTYLIMCNIKYGMNLRYTNMWDMPLRFLAFSQICWLTARLPKYQTLALIGATSVVALYDLRLYVTFFVEHPLYELVTGGLLHALKVLK